MQDGVLCWKVIDFTEPLWPLGAQLAVWSLATSGDGKTGSAPWRKQCKTKCLWMEQLTSSIFHLQLHVEVISPSQLKLLENCKSNGKWKGHCALQGLNSRTQISADLYELKGKLHSVALIPLKRSFQEAFNFYLPLSHFLNQRCLNYPLWVCF